MSEANWGYTAPPAIAMPRRPYLSDRVLCARLVACLSALWVVFGASLAQAVTLVPMCGPHAETLIAPPLSRPGSDAVIRSSACEESPLLTLQKGSPEKQRERSVTSEDAPRMPPIFFRLPSVPKIRTYVVTERWQVRPGYRSAIERPPR